MMSERTFSVVFWTILSTVLAMFVGAATMIVFGIFEAHSYMKECEKTMTHIQCIDRVRTINIREYRSSGIVSVPTDAQ